MSTPTSAEPTTAARVGPTTAPSPATAWAYLLVASALEIVFALATNATDGFTRPGPIALTVLAGAGGVYALGQALLVIDVGVAYTVWTGIGAVGAVLFGALLFDEPLSTARCLCLALVVAGVVNLRLAAGADARRAAGSTG